MKTVSRWHGVVGGIVLLGASASAQMVWTNAAGGAWNVPGNWNPNTVPGAGQTAYLTNNLGAYNVNINHDSPAAFAGMVLSSPAVAPATLNVSKNVDFGGTGFSFLMTNGVVNVLDGGTMRVLLVGNLVNSQVTVQDGGEWYWHHTATRALYNTAFTVQGNGYARFNGGSNLGMNNGTSLLVEEGGVLEHVAGWFLQAGASILEPPPLVTNRGVMDFNGNSAWLSIARNSGSTGTVGPLHEFRMESGLLLRRGTYAVDRGITIARGQNNSAAARFTLSGGIVTNLYELTVGVHEGHAAGRTVDGELLVEGGRWEQGVQLTQIGGYRIQVAVNAFNVDGIDRVHGKLTQTSGVFRAQGDLFVGNGLGTGTITLSGGEFANTNATGTALLWLGTRTNITDSVMHHGKGNLILEGGLMTLDRLVATTVVDTVSHSTINFTGGTLSVGAADVSNGTAPLLVGDGTKAATLNLRGATHRFADGLTVKANARLTVGPALAVAGTAITGNLTLEPDARLGWCFTESASDQATVVGTLTLPSEAVVELTSLDASTPQVISLMNATSITGSAEGWPRSEVGGVLYRAMSDATTLWMQPVKLGTLMLLR